MTLELSQHCVRLVKLKTDFTSQPLDVPTFMQNSMSYAPALRILVADDIEASRLLLCSLVQALGHEVQAVASGEQALKQAVLEAPDLVLLDLLMPNMDGFKVTERLRLLVTDRWLPVIVVSSLEGEEHFIQALSGGADDYLTRPINPALLDAKLRHYGQVLGLQSRLAVQSQRQRDINDNILDAVITLDGHGLIEEANFAAMRLFGDGVHRLDGQPCQRVLGVGLDRVITQSEAALTRSDGVQFQAELALSEWRESSRVHYTLVVRDLTERQHMARMKDEFLATVSHELRTPLTSVLGALGLLASGAAGALPKSAVPLAEVAKRNGERLSRLIDDILDLTKLEGNQMVLQLRPVHLEPLLREALSANQGYAQRVGVHLSLEVPEGCPQVRVDGDRFLQVMANLLSNAIKHSPTGDTVSVGLSWTQTLVRVNVRDRGPGIDPKFRARMFEKFSQADGSDRRAQGGTGLGLYITRMLVERMGGKVAVDSVAGDGATFVVELPVMDAKERVWTPWVLHIDRDVDARRRVAGWLLPLCQVEGAADLQQALAPRPDQGPAVVIADPQTQGLAEDFCAALQRLAPGRPVLLYSDALDAQFVQRMGLDWLQKSQGGGEELRVAVQAALDKTNQKASP
jgi:PAS domain S-box-containing protein